MTEQETERLLLRQWRTEDFDAYARYYADEETAKFVGGAIQLGPSVVKKQCSATMPSISGSLDLRDDG